MDYLKPIKRLHCPGCLKTVDFLLAVVQPGQTPFYFCPEKGCTHKMYVVEGPIQERTEEQWD